MAHPHMKRLLTLLALTLLPSCAETPVTHDPAPPSQHAVALRISNADVAWDGTYFGLFPSLHGASLKVSPEDISAVPALVDALSDPQRFVAAHVLLTQICGGEYALSAAAWSGLSVRLLSDGRAEISEQQIPKLQQLWSSRPCPNPPPALPMPTKER